MLFTVAEMRLKSLASGSKAGLSLGSRFPRWEKCLLESNTAKLATQIEAFWFAISPD